MSSDSEPESAAPAEQKAASSSASPSTSDRPKKKKLRRPKPPIPKTEAEIDSPSKQTVGMLGILGLMTVIMWAFARGGCNYHPPKETRTPRAVTTEDLARDPKNAAIELQQRWLTHDYKGALELATGDVAVAVQREQVGCDAACLAQHKALNDKTLTSAVILEATMMGATARVTSVGLPGGPKVYLMRMERADQIWKASMHKVDDGVALPALPAIANPHDLGGLLMSPVSGSSAAAEPAHIAEPPHPVAPTPTPAPSPSK